MVHAMKVVESIPVPTRCVKISTEKTKWCKSVDPQTASRHPKMWLSIWIAFGRLLHGTIFELRRRNRHRHGHKTQMPSWAEKIPHYRTIVPWQQDIMTKYNPTWWKCTYFLSHCIRTSGWWDENLGIGKKHKEKVSSRLEGFSGQYCVVAK